MLENPHGKRGGLVGAVVLAEHGEFVAADPRQRHAILQVGDQPRGHGLQQGVANAVSEAFVDVLEMIEVDQQQRASPFGVAGSVKVLFGPLAEQQAVGQANERVVVRQAVEFVARALERREIGEHRDVMADLALFVPDAAQVLPLRIHLATAATVPDLATPDAILVQVVPHGLVEGRVVLAGGEELRRLPEHLLGSVAGDAAERRVHMHDVLLRVGDQNAFLGTVEYGSGLPQAAFVGAARQLLGGQTVLVMLAEPVHQDAGQNDEEGALGELPENRMLRVSDQPVQQRFAEQHPKQREYGVAQTQSQEWRVHFFKSVR